MMTYLESVAKAVNNLMKYNKKCIYLGEDVRSGQRGISDGFLKKYGSERVVDTPISESAFSGYALGLAIANYRPIVEFNFAGLIYVCLDQLFNQASKFKAMSGNKKNVPIIYILPTGTKGGLAGHHSDNPYSTLSHLGIQSFMPLYSAEVGKVFKYAYKKKEPIAIFLPTEEFRSKYKFNLDKKKTPGLKKLISSKKKISKISIFCTGTTIKECVNVMKLMKNTVRVQ
jgi:Pyruvate/2-oxoglutarate dehydrogenase complex, dehydrogenase (E1) component, eukaryotic type, beta subunit